MRAHVMLLAATLCGCSTVKGFVSDATHRISPEEAKALEAKEAKQNRRSFSRANTTMEQFMKDRYECLKEAQHQFSTASAGAYGAAYGSSAQTDAVIDCSVWFSCLGARGYAVDPDGPLYAPPEMQTNCR